MASLPSTTSVSAGATSITSSSGSRGCYLWLVQVGTGTGDRPDDPAFKITAVTYGAASAITLDEFALWLNLKDVYWAREGRESVDAVILFGAALSVGLWGGPFFRALYHEARREWKRAEGLLPEGEPAG